MYHSLFKMWRFACGVSFMFQCIFTHISVWNISVLVKKTTKNYTVREPWGEELTSSRWHRWYERHADSLRTAW